VAANFSEGYRAGLPLLQRALARYGHQMPAEEELRWLWLACIAALHVWDDGTDYRDKFGREQAASLTGQYWRGRAVDQGARPGTATGAMQPPGGRGWGLEPAAIERNPNAYGYRRPGELR
jgi:hypothetical protein